jgi:hypothetical protein
MLMLLLSPLRAFAQNTTVATATWPVIGQSVDFSLANASAERWYLIQPRVGRSYCVEVGPSYIWNEYNQRDPFVYVYRADGTTPIVSNDDIQTEPHANRQSRACWIQPGAAAQTATIKVVQSDTASGYYDMRILETTSWCPWFFIDGDYNAFTLLTNTTGSAVNITVNWRDAAGTTVGTFTGSIPANGNLALNARTYVTGATAGSVQVAHTGSSEAIVGSTTTLSGTTGVGFDAPFGQRKPW